ncbi:MAG TPA: phage virion morphogenesis protein [Bacteroidia bacterium]|nr:phage virion morphogenesis protein [Bacteroidia bacterium]
MTILNIDIAGLREKLEGLYIKGANFSKIKKDIANSITETIALAFKDEQDPYGNKWKPLKWREGQILTLSGNLSKSIAYTINGERIDFGTNIIYAPTHQFGRSAMQLFPKNKKALYFKGASHPFKSAKIGKIPARPFLPTEIGGLPKSWAETIEHVFNVHLKKFDN